MEDQTSQEQAEWDERVIAIDRVARVVKGGRRFRFRAVVVVGDKKGKVGVAVSKGRDVTSAISKAMAQAKKHPLKVPLLKHGTIPHEVAARFSGAHVLLKPASPGTGVIAGGAVREVAEAAGINNILSKSLGSSNKLNNCYATLAALKQLKLAPQPLNSKPKAVAAKEKK
ncbi:30S ribosomal protein S5 [Candidatus Microgenomates bacterium]|nr:30S ribosomal protein S5 [Candidatus Microgenomates bacterium]